MIRIKKVKLKDGRVNIAYQRGAEDSWDDYTLSCKQCARPSFYDAVDNLRPEAIKIFEMPILVENLKITGVTYSYGGPNDTMGATLVAQMTLKHSVVPLNLVTPHKTEEYYNGENGDPDTLLSGDCAECLQDLAKECKRYINGEREQADLFPHGVSATFTRKDSSTELGQTAANL